MPREYIGPAIVLIVVAVFWTITSKGCHDCEAAGGVWVRGTFSGYKCMEGTEIQP